MKACTYCGRDNEDRATKCRGCGTAFAAAAPAAGSPAAASDAAGALETVAVLENEVEAVLLDALLRDRGIRHAIHSYHDSAYDGIFQAQKGWGAVLAPPGSADDVRAATEEIRRRPRPAGP